MTTSTEPRQNYRVPAKLYYANECANVSLTLVVGTNKQRIEFNIYDTIDRDDNVIEVRGFVVDGYGDCDEIVLQVVHEPGLAEVREYDYRIREMPFYEDRPIYVEYGPDGARIGLFVDGIDMVSVRE